MQNNKNEKKHDFRVVLIEDDDTMCDLISDFLDDEGYKIKVFNSIEKARSKIKTTDVLIVDVMINRKRSAGVDFVMELRKQFPEISKKEVIFISNFDKDPVEQKLEDMGDIDKWLSKPFDMLKLDQAIKGVKTNGL